MDIKVNGNNDFLDTMPEDSNGSIYDAEEPFGPYECVNCGAEYEKLDDAQDQEASKILMIRDSEPGQMFMLNLEPVCTNPNSRYYVDGNESVETGNKYFLACVEEDGSADYVLKESYSNSSIFAYSGDIVEVIENDRPLQAITVRDDDANGVTFMLWYSDAAEFLIPYDPNEE